MEDKQKRKALSKSQKAEPASKQRERRFQVWHLILAGIAVPLLAVLFPMIWNELKSESPHFTIEGGISYHPDSTIIVRAANRAARKNDPINFEIDGFLFHRVAKPIKGKDTISWHIGLGKIGLPDTVRRDGVHMVRFGISIEKMSVIQKIIFDSKEPKALVGYASESPREKHIFGQVVDDNSVVDQNINVEVAFRHKEKLLKIELPVREYISENGQKIYEFEYRVQNIPQISKGDPEYHEPFFALKINDEAGNEFSQESTYDAFMTEGIQTFGNKSAQVIMQKIMMDELPAFNLKVSSVPKHRLQNIASGPR